MSIFHGGMAGFQILNIERVMKLNPSKD